MGYRANGSSAVSIKMRRLSQPRDDGAAGRQGLSIGIFADSLAAKSRPRACTKRGNSSQSRERCAMTTTFVAGARFGSYTDHGSIAWSAPRVAGDNPKEFKKRESTLVGPD
jgi:hypothetical protein